MNYFVVDIFVVKKFPSFIFSSTEASCGIRHKVSGVGRLNTTFIRTSTVFWVAIRWALVQGYCLLFMAASTETTCQTIRCRNTEDGNHLQII